MAADEDATVAALDSARAVFKARIEGNQGRIIDMAGDSVLAVFETAAGAASAALAIQKEIESSSGAAPEERRMRFRIGVHIGDVIEKADGTVYGDGVNIAARLQALAEPGSVTVSGMVHEAVRDRISATFADQGEHEVKNIARPVHVYRIDFVTDGVTAAPRVAKKVVQPERRRPWLLAFAVASLLAAAIGAWIAAADSARDARDLLASWLGKKASQASSARATVAVMPFTNQSSDAKRDYFSDGVTQDIINALGRFSGVMVISHNAVQAYKGRPMTSAEISRELDVRYIAQGSVRQADDKLRVAVELSDAEKGTQLWSERFEGTGQQVFEIQDQIVKNIVGALAVKLTSLEQQRVFSKPTESLEAYDLVLRARALLLSFERTSNREARNLLAQALKLAPNYAAAYVALGEAEMQRGAGGWVEDVEESIKKSEALVKKALAIDDPAAHARAHGLLGRIYTILGKYDQALAEVDQALELNASDSDAYQSRGEVLLWLGRIEESIASYETARRFDLRLSVVSGVRLSLAYNTAGRYREALAVTDSFLTRYPNSSMLHAIRAAAFAQLGNAAEAGLAADQVRRFNPLFQVEQFATRFVNPEHQARTQEALRKAGL